MNEKLKLSNFLQERRVLALSGVVLAASLVSMGGVQTFDASEVESTQEITTQSTGVCASESDFEGVKNHFVVSTNASGLEGLESTAFATDGVTCGGTAWTDIAGNRLSVNLLSPGRRTISYYTYNNAALTTSTAYVLRDSEINIVLGEDGVVTETDILNSAFAENSGAVNDVTVLEGQITSTGEHKVTLVEPTGETFELTVNVLEEDTEAPVVTVETLSSTLNYTGKYNPLDNITVTDNVDYKFDVSVEGRKMNSKVDESQINWDLTLKDISTQTGDSAITDSVGEYQIRYTVEDSSGNVGGLESSEAVEGEEVVATRTVYNNVYIEAAETSVAVPMRTSFNSLSGVTARETNVSAAVDVTDALVVDEGNLDTEEPGVYTLTYDVDYDELGTEEEYTKVTGNTEVEVEVTNEAPVITGVADKTVQYGASFNAMSGVTATDTEDGEVEITVSGTVDTKTVNKNADGSGESKVYTLTYTAVDSAGAITEETREITVLSYVDNVTSNGDKYRDYYAGNKKTGRRYYYGNVGSQTKQFITYAADGQTAIKRHYYHSNGKTKQINIYHSNGNLEKTTYYNTSGVKTKHKTTHSSSNSKTSKEWTYFSNGKVSKRTTYGTSGKVTEIVTYHSNGKTKVRDTYKNGVRNDYKEYYSNGKLSKKYTYYSNGKVKTRHTYRNDSKNTLATYYYKYSNGKTKDNRTYFTNGKWSTRTLYASDGDRTSHKEYYSNGKTKKNYTYHSNGKVKERSDYTSKGKITKKVTYDSKGKTKSVRNYS